MPKWGSDGHHPAANANQSSQEKTGRFCTDSPRSLGTLSESIDKIGAHYASLGPGIPDPTDDGVGASSSDGRIRDSYRIAANSVLGGLHHEYRLEPVGCLSPATSIAFAEHKVAPHERPRRSRAAATMAATLADAISSVFIGRFEKVPNPQSGFRNTRSAG